MHDAVVKEDGSVVVPITATLDPKDSPNAVLTVTVTAVLIDAVLGAIQSRVALWQGEGERG